MKHTYLVRNTVLLSINKLSSALAIFILLPLYTKYFSAGDYGAVDLILGYIALVAPVLSLKLDMGIFKYLIDARGDEERVREAISSLMQLLVALLVISTISAFILGKFISVPFYTLVILAIVANVSFGMLSQITRGIGMTRDYVGISIITTVISFLITVIGIVVLHVNVEIILISLIVSQAIGTILMISKTRVYRIVQWRLSSRHVQRQLLKYSAPLVVDGVSFWVMNTSSRTILTVVIGVAANGIYAVASKFSAIIEQAIGVFFQSFIETATLYAKNPNKSELYSDVMNKYLRLLWSCCILLIAVVPFVFPVLVHGNEFAAAYIYIPIMIIATMARAVQNFISAIYQANGHTKQVANTTIVGAIINLVTNLGLVFVIGIWSAVVSSLVAYLTLGVYRYFDIRKYDVVLKLRRKTLVIFAVLATFVLICYYLHSLWSTVLSLVVAGVVTVLLNRRVLVQVLKYISHNY